MTRIIAHSVVRNEQDRFLDAAMTWNSQWVDAYHVYDDRSEDDTLGVVLRHTDLVGVRPEGATSFAEDESVLRQAAWENMIEVVNPGPSDFILALDADEFILGNHKESPREALEKTCDYIEAVGAMAADIKRLIVWEWGETPMTRIDGLWAKDRQVRLAKFNPKAKAFRKGALGCGSLPQYASKHCASTVTYAYIMDLGYAIDGAPQAKYDFYKSRSGDNHRPEHIESIIQKPKLTGWHGQVPKVF